MQATSISPGRALSICLCIFSGDELAKVAKSASRPAKRFHRRSHSCASEGSRAREAFRSVLGIRRPLAANAALFVVHPIVHVEDKLGDGVGKTFDLARGQFGREIFDTGERIGVCPFGVQQLGYGA